MSRAATGIVINAFLSPDIAQNLPENGAGRKRLNPRKLLQKQRCCEICLLIMLILGDFDPYISKVNLVGFNTLSFLAAFSISAIPGASIRSQNPEPLTPLLLGGRVKSIRFHIRRVESGGTRYR
jgi:hypothetical protein